MLLRKLNISIRPNTKTKTSNQHVSEEITHVRHRILVVIARRDFVRILTSNQESTAVESSRQARDHSIHLSVGACGEWTRRAAEDVTRSGLGEGDGAVIVGEQVVLDAAGDIAEGCLRVDYEVFVGVACPDLQVGGVSESFRRGLEFAPILDRLPWLM